MRQRAENDCRGAGDRGANVGVALDVFPRATGHELITRLAVIQRNEHFAGGTREVALHQRGVEMGRELCYRTITVGVVAYAGYQRDVAAQLCEVPRDVGGCAAELVAVEKAVPQQLAPHDEARLAHIGLQAEASCAVSMKR